MVLDVCSGSVHVVDDLSYDVIALYEDHTEEEIVKNLSDRYSEKDIREAFQEVKELAEEGMLFTEDQYESYIFDVKQRSTVVKALCLHIAHDCNLACLVHLQVSVYKQLCVNTEILEIRLCYHLTYGIRHTADTNLDS